MTAPGAGRTVQLSAAYVGEREEELVLEVLRSGRLSLGPMIDRFEEAFAAAVGAPYAAAVSSGTAGLHLLSVLAGLQPGDEAITSPFSFAASANCFVYTGATPVFADIDPGTLNMDPAAVEAAITPRTKAIIAVDIFGYPCELAELQALARKHGLALIDDSCEALGAVYKGKPLGAHGQDAVWAFYPNKQMTTGEGGMVTTHDERTWKMVKSLRNQGRADGGGWLDHAYLGFNYRIDDIRAAIGLAQVEKLSEILRLRDAVAQRYHELLGGIEGIELPHADDADHTRSWFVYVLKLDPGIDRERVIAELGARGVATSRYLPSIHLQSYMRERYGFREGLCPVSEGISARTVALPFYTALSADDQAYVAESLRAALAAAR